MTPDRYLTINPHWDAEVTTWLDNLNRVSSSSHATLETAPAGDSDRDRSDADGEVRGEPVRIAEEAEPRPVDDSAGGVWLAVDPYGTDTGDVVALSVSVAVPGGDLRAESPDPLVVVPDTSVQAADQVVLSWGGLVRQPDLMGEGLATDPLYDPLLD